MPPFDKHNLQYERNKDHLNLLLKSDNPHYDWVVTVTFYCAVHLIEKELSRYSKHPGNHQKRFEAINEKITLDTIADVYQALYNESRTSRYKCTNINLARAESAIKYLEKIEKELA